MAMLRSFLRASTKRGLTLLETLLALAVGAVVIVQSVSGINQYTESVQVQAAGGQLERIIAAADTWANDRYETLSTGNRFFTAADTQTQLAPYLGGSFPQDAFRNSYRMVTRTYTYPVPDPATGGTIQRTAVQVLVVGFNTNPGPLASEADLRINIANTAGRGAGFVSSAVATCDNGSGGRLPAGNICGAYGSYALNASQFPAGALANAFILGLVTKGDSSFYGDQLYRYNYGDPDLNTMRTSLLMDSAPGNANEIQSPRQSLTLRSNTAAGNNASVLIGRPNGGPGLAGDIIINPGTSNTVVINGEGANPSLRTDTNVLLMGQQTNTTLRDSSGRNLTTQLANGQIRAGQMFSNIVGAEEVSSLWRQRDTPLRLQNFARGEVIIGQRGRYRPFDSGTAVPGLNYELSDGRLVAGHVVSQDITCADCGGSLSQILPRWRHMGTYFIGYTRGGGTRVNHPSCGDSRRNMQSRSATSTNQAYAETVQDDRYRPAILLIPRQIASKNLADAQTFGTNGDYSHVPMDAHFRAEQPVNGAGVAAPYWNVILHKTSDNVYSTAFALTYCVFTGGSAAMSDPTSTVVPGMFEQTPTNMGTWTPLP